VVEVSFFSLFFVENAATCLLKHFWLEGIITYIVNRVRPVQVQGCNCFTLCPLLNQSLLHLVCNVMIAGIEKKLAAIELSE